jgi:GNAT superfamily N-acetyltransferase
MRVSVSNLFTRRTEHLEGTREEIDGRLVQQFPEVAGECEPDLPLEELVQHLNDRLLGYEIEISAFEPVQKAEPVQGPYRYAGNCTHLNGDVIGEMKRTGKMMDEDEFHAMAHPGDLAGLDQQFQVPIKKDWHVGYFKGPLPSGKPAIWFTHSNIEHVFTPDGQVDDEVPDDDITKAEEELDSAEPNDRSLDAPAPKPVQAKPKPPKDKNLVVTHNLSASGLLHAHELGGLAAPSLAVSHRDHPLTGFGDITLVAHPSLIDPRENVPVFDADIYSPRHPRAKFRADPKRMQRLITEMKPYFERATHGGGNLLEDEFERGGVEGVLDHRSLRVPLQLRYLEEKGLKTWDQDPQEPVRLNFEWASSPVMKEFVAKHGRDINFEHSGDYHKALSQAARSAIEDYWSKSGDDPELQQDLKENSLSHHFGDDGLFNFGRAWKLFNDIQNAGKTEIDRGALSDHIREAMAGREPEFEAWARQKLKPVEKDRYLPKYMNSGGVRRLPYTLETVLKEMTRKTRGGETDSPAASYGLGGARSMGAKRYRTLEQIAADRHRLISKPHFEALKRENDERFGKLVDSLGHYSNHAGSFGEMGAVAQAIADSYKRGWGIGRALHENGIQGVPPDLQREVAKFADDLRQMPTEYFEAKPQRAVGLHEFQGAVVPEDVHPNILQVLQQHGLPVETYKRDPNSVDDDKKARAEAIRRLAESKQLMLGEPSWTKMEKMAKIYDHPTQPMMVWRYENADGVGPHRSGAVSARASVNRPAPVKDFDAADWNEFGDPIYEGEPSSEIRFGFLNEVDAHKWFGARNKDKLYHAGQDLVQVPAKKVWRSRSGKQVAFIPHQEDLGKMAIADIPPGQKTRKRAHLDGLTRYDYSHVLPPKYQQAGAKLYLDAGTWGHMRATIIHPGDRPTTFEGNAEPGEIGMATGLGKPQESSLAMGAVHVRQNHWKQGLGQSLYEAMFAHAKNVLGLKTVHGGEHSTMAHEAHRKLSAKHGMEYVAGPQQGATAKPGPYDDKFGPYEYTLKSEPLEKMARLNYDTPEFKTWFQGSKVAHPDGRPMTVYHGTSKDMDFKTFKVGQRGSWFTTDPEAASSYAMQNDSQGSKWDHDQGTYVSTNTAPRVIPAHLSIKNPYRLTPEEKKAHQEAPNYAQHQRHLFSRIYSQGHDGVDMEGGVWVAFHPHQIKSIFNTVPTQHKAIHKSEPGNDDSQGANLGVRGDSSVVDDMHGFRPQMHTAFVAARFWTGGMVPTLEMMRRALYDADGDLEAAALRVYGLEPTAANRKTLHSIQQYTDLGKAENPHFESIRAGVPEAEQTAEGVQSAIDNGRLEPVTLRGRHSAGSLLAHGPHEVYLLKPGAGGQSPAAGDQQDRASQSRREAAFWHVANAWSLGDTIPRADLVLIDGREYAAIHMLPHTWTNAVNAEEKEPNKVIHALERYRQDGTLHQWALLDFILGNPDMHARNLMVSPDGECKLIDHGSAFAGSGFDPAHDKNSFVPYYLRARVPSGAWNDLSARDRERRMPTLSENSEKRVRAWFQALDAGRMASILQEYGINPQPCLERYEHIRKQTSLTEVPMDQVINGLWVTV